MAGNSSTYFLRQEANKSNLDRWAAWSIGINHVVDQFNTVITDLSDRLEMAETTIDSLLIKINELQKANAAITAPDYVRLQYSQLEIASSDRQVYTRSCGVFSFDNKYHDDHVSNTVYVYSDRSVNGLYVNGATVYASKIGRFLTPFTEFTGSEKGIMAKIKTDNADKVLRENVNLYFSLDASIKDTSIDDPSVAAKLQLKIKYSPVVIKEIAPIDKKESKLFTALTNVTPKIADTYVVQASLPVVSQYSVKETVAKTAKTGIATKATTISSNLLQAPGKVSLSTNKKIVINTRKK